MDELVINMTLYIVMNNCHKPWDHYIAQAGNRENKQKKEEEEGKKHCKGKSPWFLAKLMKLFL